jgi:hypothetical protein
LLLASHDKELRRRVYNLEFSQYRRCVRGQDHLLEVVYDDFVAAIGSERRLNRLGNGAACVDVANNSAIFGVVAVAGWLVEC